MGETDEEKAADPSADPEPAFWRRPVVWLGGVGTAVLIGVLIGVLTPIVQRLLSPSAPSPAQPLQIQSAGYLAGFNEVFAFPYSLSRAQMIAATRGIARNDFGQNLKFVAALGGAPTHLQLIQVVLHSDVTQVATINEIRVVKQCTAPFSGTELWNPAQAGIDNISMGFNLDSATPYAQFVNPGNQFYGNYFAKKSIQFAPGESSTLAIYVLTTRQSCQFTFNLYVDYGARQYVEHVRNSGKPFELSAGLSFSRFKVIYAGGNATENGAYVQEDPRTYQG
jgi:hypothetical protein